MKRILFILTLAFVASSTWAQSLLVGDSNQDGSLTVADVTTSVDMILGRQPQTVIDLNPYRVDNSLVAGTWYIDTTPVTFNADGTTDYAGAAAFEFRPWKSTLILLDASDEIMKVYNILRLGTGKLTLQDSDGTTVSFSDTKGHEYVDLGLTSGTLWATTNMGATNPEDYGDYFAWGETSPKTYFGWDAYKYSNGSYDSLTKYCSHDFFGYNGFTDGLTELELADDAAYMNWGHKWRMPTSAQLEELSNQCTWTYTTINGVNGNLGVGPNGNSIFLPAAGSIDENGASEIGEIGIYKSSTRSPNSPDQTLMIFNSFISPCIVYSKRNAGSPIRPVRNTQQ